MTIDIQKIIYNTKPLILPQVEYEVFLYEGTVYGDMVTIKHQLGSPIGSFKGSPVSQDPKSNVRANETGDMALNTSEYIISVLELPFGLTPKHKIIRVGCNTIYEPIIIVGEDLAGKAVKLIVKVTQ